MKKHLADVEAELVPELQANLLEAKRSADEAKRRAEDSEKALRDQEGLIIRERPGERPQPERSCQLIPPFYIVLVALLLVYWKNPVRCT